MAYRRRALFIHTYCLVFAVTAPTAKSVKKARIMDGPAGKHKLTGIGGASAKLVLAAFAGNPSLAFLTVGLPGKFVAWFLTQFFSALASVGLVLLNVGAARVETYLDGNSFDGSLDTAEKMIADIRRQGRELTPEEIKKIDDPVISAFRRWASFARRKP